MTRIVTLEDTKPLMIDPSQSPDKVWVCRCGLSNDWPYCDGSHKQARDEQDGVTYAYRRDGEGALARTVIDDPPAANPRT